jgi:hypothetical protein
MLRGIDAELPCSYEKHPKYFNMIVNCTEIKGPIGMLGGQNGRHFWPELTSRISLF